MPLIRLYRTLINYLDVTGYRKGSVSRLLQLCQYVFDRVSLNTLTISFLAGGWQRAHPATKIEGGNSLLTGSELDISVLSFTFISFLIPKRLFPQHTIMKMLYEKVPQNNAEKRLLKKLRDFYSSCMDISKINELGHEPLLGIVQQIRKLLPSDSPSTTRAYRLAAALAYMHSIGAAHFLPY